MAEVVGADEQRDEQRRLACLGGKVVESTTLAATRRGSRAALLVLIKQP